MTAETIMQSLASGLLMGLLYGLIAVGLALIFGLMDVVNFAHGELITVAGYCMFFVATNIIASPWLALGCVLMHFGEAAVASTAPTLWSEMFSPEYVAAVSASTTAKG